MKSIPITLITGYLGSGKTTLLNHILTNQEGYKTAVIVNDIGEVNVDANLIEKGGVVSGKDDSLIPLQNGCICCSLNADLLEQIQNIIEMKKFDHIIIEASGICEPVPIAQTLCALEDAYLEYNMPRLCYLDSIISVVDAKRMSDEFNSGSSLLNEHREEDIASLVIDQIEFCDTIILNKTNEVTKDELENVKTVLKALQPVAKVFETNYSKVDLKDILETKRFNFDKIATSSGWYQKIDTFDAKEADEAALEEHHCHHDGDHECCHHHDHEGEHECCHKHDHDENHECHHDHKDGECHCHHHHEEGHNHGDEYGINTFVYYRREPMDRKKFYEYISKPWPKKIIRAKGITYFKDDKDMSFMFEQAGSLKDLQEAGLWLAAEDPKFRQEVMEQNPELKNDWDDFYGDRMVKIVFIGQNITLDDVKAELDEI